MVPGPTSAPAVPDVSLACRAGEAWNWAVNRLSCRGEVSPVALTDGVQWMDGAVSSSASATWNAMVLSEGQVVYNLFRRQLAVFIPSFDPAAQF